jgi:hypothetical protein
VTIEQPQGDDEYEVAEPDQPTLAIDVPDLLEDRTGEPVEEQEFRDGGAASGRPRPRFERLKEQRSRH